MSRYQIARANYDNKQIFSQISTFLNQKKKKTFIYATINQNIQPKNIQSTDMLIISKKFHQTLNCKQYQIKVSKSDLIKAQGTCKV